MGISEHVTTTFSRWPRVLIETGSVWKHVHAWSLPVQLINWEQGLTRLAHASELLEQVSLSLELNDSEVDVYLVVASELVLIAEIL